MRKWRSRKSLDDNDDDDGDMYVVWCGMHASVYVRYAVRVLVRMCVFLLKNLSADAQTCVRLTAGVDRSRCRNGHYYVNEERHAQAGERSAWCLADDDDAPASMRAEWMNGRHWGK